MSWAYHQPQLLPSPHSSLPGVTSLSRLQAANTFLINSDFLEPNWKNSPSLWRHAILPFLPESHCHQAGTVWAGDTADLSLAPRWWIWDNIVVVGCCIIYISPQPPHPPHSATHIAHWACWWWWGDHSSHLCVLCALGEVFTLEHYWPTVAWGKTHSASRLRHFSSASTRLSLPARPDSNQTQGGHVIRW